MIENTSTPDVLIVSPSSVPEVPLGSVGTQRVLLGAPLGDTSPVLLGLSTVEAGQTSPSIEHDTAEVAYVTAGSGAMVTEDGERPFVAGDAILIEPHAWHAICADVDAAVQMVFVFPTPALPPTRHRDDR